MVLVMVSLHIMISGVGFQKLIWNPVQGLVLQKCKIWFWIQNQVQKLGQVLVQFLALPTKRQGYCVEISL
jgi:hypothetical protein